MNEPHHTTPDAAVELLRWYQSMGIDEAVAEAPTDWSRLTASAVMPAVAKAFPHEVQAPVKRTAPGFPARSDEHRASSFPARSDEHRASSFPARSDEHRASSFPARSGEHRAVTALPPMSQPIARANPTTAPDASAMAARELARHAPDLATLEAALTSFDGCPLKKTAKHMCFARGRPGTGLMLIGEAPGRDEDLQGQPFVGKAGQLLDKMLAAIGIGPDEAYITNVVYWRPPGNRTPTPQEVQACQPFLERQIELVAPDVLVLLGGAAAKQMLATDEGIMKLRGKWKGLQTAGRTIRTMATLHPAYLLRNPAAKRHVWRDLLAIKAALAEGRSK